MLPPVGGSVSSRVPRSAKYVPVPAATIAPPAIAQKSGLAKIDLLLFASGRGARRGAGARGGGGGTGARAVFGAASLPTSKTTSARSSKASA